MSGTVNTNSTKVAAISGSSLFSPKYDNLSRKSELADKSLLSDYTFIATVIEVNQQLQVCRIRTSGMADMIAVPLEASGKTVGFSGRTSTLHGVGSTVLAMTTPSIGVGHAVILGAVSTYLGPVTSFGSPELTPSSPVGSFKDSISDSGLLNCNYYNFNAGRPVDVYPGETTMLNTLGCGLMVGTLQTSLISGLDCSVECHYLDALVRINAFNYEHNTAGAETGMFADAGDYTEIKRLNPYVIESLGGTEQYGAVPKQDAEDRTGYKRGATITGNYKLTDPSQIGWWRYSELNGYLGNLKLAFGTVPDLDSIRLATNKEQDERGVFREHVDATGAYSVVSAKSIALIKDCFIPVPKQVYRPDDNRGDAAKDIESARTENETNAVDYEVSGYYSDETGALVYAATSSDAAAFRTHRSLLNFRERSKDWMLFEIDEIDLLGFKDDIASTGFINAQDGIQAGQLFAKPPKYGFLKINAREEVKYFASRSMIMMHEDGSIHIQDGYGSSISMRAGCIDISCPGDITLRPGRNLVSMAGDSVSHIAGNDVELSANLGDVRIHADRNVSVLAGNNGSGGILLESKAEASNLYDQDTDIFKDPNNNANEYRGIWLKAPGASVGTLSKEAYIGNATDDCAVYIDSGQDSITMTGAQHVIESSESLFLTNKDNPAAGTNILISDSGVAMQSLGGFFLQGSSLLATGQQTDMQVLVKGTGVFSEGLISRSYGGISTQIGKVQDSDLQSSVKAIQTATTAQDKRISDVLTNMQTLDELLSVSLIGSSSSSLTYLTFCYPNSELRDIPSDVQYLMLESDWQQAYRNQGVGDTMVFKGVDTSKKSGATDEGITESNTYFWPGATALSGKFAKLKSTDRFVDDKLRFQKDGFDTPTDAVDSPTSFESAYTIVAKNKIRYKE
jgi:hypothetical protein